MFCVSLTSTTLKKENDSCAHSENLFVEFDIDQYCKYMLFTAAICDRSLHCITESPSLDTIFLLVTLVHLLLLRS